MRRNIWAEYRPHGAIGLFRVREYATFEPTDADAIQYVFDTLQTAGYETRGISTSKIEPETCDKSKGGV